MPQLNWHKVDDLPLHRLTITTITTEYDRMTSWCELNCRGDYLQSWGGEPSSQGGKHRFFFTDAEDLMLFRLTFGGTILPS